MYNYRNQVIMRLIHGKSRDECIVLMDQHVSVCIRGSEDGFHEGDFQFTVNIILDTQ